MENQIQSFATFSETRKAAMETKLREEASAKRTTEAQRFADLLAEYEVSTVAEIAEEQRTEFFAKLVGETDEIETEGNAFGAAVVKAKKEGEDEFTVGGETYKVKESVEEGRAFVAAVNKARKAGEETFEFNGKTYKVTKKINEAKVDEADVKSDEDFKEYAFAVLKKAFGDDFDEAKAQEVVDGILDKCGDDYGACVGTLQASLG